MSRQRTIADALIIAAEICVEFPRYLPLYERLEQDYLAQQRMESVLDRARRITETAKQTSQQTSQQLKISATTNT